MMGISTGFMPDVEFIWAVQAAEASHQCFGRGITCDQRQCRWRKLCLALDFYADVTLPIAADPAGGSRKPRKTPQRTSPVPVVEREPVSARTLEPVATASSRS